MRMTSQSRSAHRKQVSLSAGTSTALAKGSGMPSPLLSSGAAPSCNAIRICKRWGASKPTHGYGIYEACRRLRTKHGEPFFDVQNARTAVVPQAIGDVAILLCFQQHDSGTNGVDRACIDENHVTCTHGEHAQTRLKTAVLDG